MCMSTHILMYMYVRMCIHINMHYSCIYVRFIYWYYVVYHSVSYFALSRTHCKSSKCFAQKTIWRDGGVRGEVTGIGWVERGEGNTEAIYMHMCILYTLV